MSGFVYIQSKIIMPPLRDTSEREVLKTSTEIPIGKRVERWLLCIRHLPARDEILLSTVVLDVANAVIFGGVSIFLLRRIDNVFVANLSEPESSNGGFPATIRQRLR